MNFLSSVKLRSCGNCKKSQSDYMTVFGSILVVLVSLDRFNATN